MARLLVVEDHEGVRESLATLCTSWGHEVATTSNGGEAFALVAAFRPDVVLLDMTLPSDIGSEIARRIRAIDGWSIFIVALSAWTSAAERARALVGGANAFMPKPPDPHGLRRTIDRAAAKRVKRRRSRTS